MKTLLRLAAVALLACFTSVAHAEETKDLIAKLGDKDSTIRRNAADALGQNADKSAVSALDQGPGR